MVSKTMFGKLRKDSRRAMTLSELSVATAVSAIILTALIGFTVYASRTFAAMGNYVDLEQRSQYALDTMVRDIRTTQGLSLIHISEPTRLLSISYAVFCLKKK